MSFESRIWFLERSEIPNKYVIESLLVAGAHSSGREDLGSPQLNRTYPDIRIIYDYSRNFIENDESSLAAGSDRVPVLFILLHFHSKITSIPPALFGRRGKSRIMQCILCFRVLADARWTRSKTLMLSGKTKACPIVQMSDRYSQTRPELPAKLTYIST
ncbi:hypothetical protein KQX54_002023 [Cotesia glomerata]|uniref:Maturase K n=1 Tax=Cotesia glomerata TaxID=32391 RepID=A0AAV7I4K2_COTGL|nr:hypothetical protein KQX54_002023 [Cotesia glomerata]